MTRSIVLPVRTEAEHNPRLVFRVSAATHYLLRRALAAMGTAVLLGAVATAQAPTPGLPLLTETSVPTLTTRVQEVPLTLSVTDHRGKYVDGLTETDLKILDNNQEQTAVTFFEHETNLPLDVGIVIDLSSSVSNRFETEQSTIKSFIHTITRPADSVKVFAFNDQVQLVSEVHSHWKEISRRIKKLKPHGNTALYDALTEAVDSFGKETMNSRRIIIVITDGEENSSIHTLDGTIARALKADCAIYAVNVSPSIAYEDDDAKRGEHILNKLPAATGGNYFRANEGGDLSGAFGKIRRELRSQYAIAYRPSNIAGEAFHRIQVIAGRKLHVRCRSGYYVR